MRVLPGTFYSIDTDVNKNGDQKSKLVYFSSTRTSRETVEAVAEWLATDYSERRNPGVFL